MKSALIALGLCFASVNFWEIAAAQGAVLAHWQFESEADFLKDSAGSNHLRNTIGPYVVPGATFASGDANAPSAGYAYFDGTFGMSTFNRLNLVGKTSLTIEFFYKADGGTGEQMLFEHRHAATGADGGFFGLVDSGPNQLYSYYRESNTKWGHIRSTADPSAVDNQWHHVAFVFNRNASTTESLKIYFDHQLVTGALIADSATSPLTNPFLDDWFYLGARDFLMLRFQGWMDEFRISDTELTPDQFLQFSSAVPEPSALALCAGALAGLACCRKRRK